MAYHLEGRLLEVCNCRVLCPCWIGEDPDFGTCDTIVAWHFDKGTIDGVDVSDRTIAMIAHVPGNILQGNWRAAVYLDERVTPAQEEAILDVYTGKQGGPVAELAKLVGEVVSVEKVPITFTVQGGQRHDQARRRRLRRARAVQERHRRHDDAGRHGVLDGAGRAGVRRQGAALPVEEREARHRPRHQGPQRAAEHVRVRVLTVALAARRARRRAWRAQRHADARSTAAPALGALLGAGERRRCSPRCWRCSSSRRGRVLWLWSASPYGRYLDARRLGRRRRARGALPRGSAGRHRRAGAAARGRVGADDRGDDAADDVSAAGDCSGGSPARGRTRGGSWRSSSPGFFAAWFAFGVRRARCRRGAALGRRRAAPGSSPTAGWSAPRCWPAPGSSSAARSSTAASSECRTPFGFVASRWHGRSPRARGVPARLRPRRSSASAAAGR